MDHFLLTPDIKKIDFRMTTGHDLLVKLPAQRRGRLTLVLRAGEQAEQRQKQVCGSNLVM